MIVTERAVVYLMAGVQFVNVLDFMMVNPLGPDLAESLAIPTSLHDSLMARLDRMQPVKDVAQTAACIGREFSFRLLRVVIDLSDGELGAALRKATGRCLTIAEGVDEATRALDSGAARARVEELRSLLS